MTNEERAAEKYIVKKEIDIQGFGRLDLSELQRSAYIAGLEANEWVSVDDGLPETLETVWLCNIKTQSANLGCLVDPPNEGWHWAETNGVIYVEDGSIVSECESDDLDVTHWASLPKLPQPPKDKKG